MEAMGIIFSNIYDNNMGELTRERTSASIPFGSRYRQIDFALSNMANSKISNIGIVTKYNYQSLMDHLGNCEEWDLKLGEGRPLPASVCHRPYRSLPRQARSAPDRHAGSRPLRCGVCRAVRYDRSVRDQFCGSSG